MTHLVSVFELLRRRDLIFNGVAIFLSIESITALLKWTKLLTQCYPLIFNLLFIGQNVVLAPFLHSSDLLKFNFHG